MEVPDEPLASSSESDDEDVLPPQFSDSENDSQSDNEDTDEDSDVGTDHGPDADDFALSPDTPASLPFCTCSNDTNPNSAEDLGDNGIAVTYQQRKMWEKWVCGRCPEHSLT